MTICFIIWLVTSASVSADLLVPSGPPTLEQAVKQVASLSSQPGRQRLADLLDEVRRLFSKGDHAAWVQLRPVITDSKVHLPARRGVLQIAIDKADETIGRDLLELAAAESAAVTQWVQQGAPPESVPEEGQVLRVIAPLLDEAPWKDWNAKRSGDGLELIYQISIGTCRSLNGHRLGLDALIVSPVSQDRKRAIAERVVRISPRAPVTDPRLLSFLGAASFPALRTMVRESGVDPKTFHGHAASVLAHFGDQEIVPHLQFLIKECQEGRVATDPTMPNLVSRFQESLGWTIRRIEMQHPPEKLLEFIASDELPLDPTMRIWAMERAVDYKLDRGAIRDAVLYHGEKMRKMLKAGTLPGRPDLPPAGLSLTKHAAVRLGILTANDWPDVMLPKEPTGVTE